MIKIIFFAIDYLIYQSISFILILILCISHQKNEGNGSKLYKKSNDKSKSKYCNNLFCILEACNSSYAKSVAKTILPIFALCC